MKHVCVVLAIVAASLSYSTMVLSEENTAGLPNEYGQYKIFDFKGQKDDCLIVAKNCISGDESVMKRVERLTREIEKGAEVYTPEELKIFQGQLNWINSESKDYSVDRY